MPQIILPAPRTWATDDLITVPRLRADVSNAVAFLANRPAFVGQDTNGSSWGSGSDAPFGLNAELLDNWSGHVPVTMGASQSSQYWCQVPGWYLCRSAPAWAYTSATQGMFAGGLQALSNGVAQSVQRGPLVLSGSTHAPNPQCIDLVKLVNTGAIGGSGDYVQFMAIQATGSSVNLEANAGQLPTASARWVCAISGTEPLPVPPLTAVPSPITSAWCNANIRDTINQLIYPPICRAYYSGSLSLASSTFPAGNTVPLNNVTVDNYGGYNTSTYTYTAPLAGRYLVAGQFNLNSNTGTTGYCCGISINGGTTIWGDSTYKVSDTSGGGAGFVKRVRLTAGQTVQLVACQGTGSSVAYATVSTNPSRMIVVWEGS